jgi:phospholipid/cholesterol/gamma-HCH transport system permease protein
MELSISAVKSLFFGLLLSAACTACGLGVGASATQVPQAATRGVMQSLFLVFIVDGIMAIASLAIRNG